MKRATLIWLFVFIGFAVLATLFLMIWASTEPGLWGFPRWIFSFIGIHLGFSAAVWIFAYTFWNEETEE